MAWRRLAFWSALLLGSAAILYSAYIPAKAWLAQRLLEQAWQRQQQAGVATRPWPWADTEPVARLHQTRLAVDQVVLAGASGRVLAFGPGHVTGTARPGSGGNSVISAHRDTHFRWLRDVVPGDMLGLETATGDRLVYRIATTAVHHESDLFLLDPAAGHRLTLITCYPFDAVDPGTVLRFVVTAFPRSNRGA